MLLMKYFGFVGGGLVLLLWAVSWLLPESNAEPVRSGINLPVIRISSIETLPAKVVFDTSTPSIVPPSSDMRVAARPLQSAYGFEQITPGSLPILSTLAQVTPKTITEKRDPGKMIAKREPAKKVVAHRAAPQGYIAAVKNYPAGEADRDSKAPIKSAERDSQPHVKTTFLDDIAGRFGQMFKVN